MATKAAATTRNVTTVSRSGPAARAVSPKLRPVVRRPQASKAPKSGSGPPGSSIGSRTISASKADKLLLSSHSRGSQSTSRGSCSSRDSTPSPSLGRPPGEKKKVTFNAIFYEYDSDGSSRGQSIDRQPTSKRNSKNGPTVVPTAVKPRDLSTSPEVSETDDKTIECVATEVGVSKQGALEVNSSVTTSAGLMESKDSMEPLGRSSPSTPFGEADDRFPEQVEPSTATTLPPSQSPPPPLFEGALPKARFELSRLYKSKWKERFLRLYPDRLEYGKWNRRNPRSKQFGRLVLRKGSPLLLNASMEVTVEDITKGRGGSRTTQLVPRLIRLRLQPDFHSSSIGAADKKWVEAIVLDDPKDKKLKGTKFLEQLRLLEAGFKARSQLDGPAVSEGSVSKDNGLSL